MPKKRKKTKSMGKICHKKTIIDGITFDSKTEAEYYLYITTISSSFIITFTFPFVTSG